MVPDHAGVTSFRQIEVGGPPLWFENLPEGAEWWTGREWKYVGKSAYIFERRLSLSYVPMEDDFVEARKAECDGWHLLVWTSNWPVGTDEELRRWDMEEYLDRQPGGALRARAPLPDPQGPGVKGKP